MMSRNPMILATYPFEAIAEEIRRAATQVPLAEATRLVLDALALDASKALAVAQRACPGNPAFRN